MKVDLSQKEVRSPETKDVTVRLPLSLYLELLDEGKESSQSVEQLILKAILLRKLRTVEKQWQAENIQPDPTFNPSEEEVEKDIAEALAEVRQERRERIRLYLEEGV